MAPPRRPGLTIILNKAADSDPMTVLLWTAVPLECCTPEMLAFRANSEPLRVSDCAVISREGMPRSDNPAHPTIKHWQAGGVVLFGYPSVRVAQAAKVMLAEVYIAQSGRVAIRNA